jgi:hypothetical protein
MRDRWFFGAIAEDESLPQFLKIANSSTSRRRLVQEEIIFSLTCPAMVLLEILETRPTIAMVRRTPRRVIGEI